MFRVWVGSLTFLLMIRSRKIFPDFYPVSTQFIGKHSRSSGTRTNPASSALAWKSFHAASNQRTFLLDQKLWKDPTFSVLLGLDLDRVWFRQAVVLTRFLTPLIQKFPENFYHTSEPSESFLKFEGTVRKAQNRTFSAGGSGPDGSGTDYLSC